MPHTDRVLAVFATEHREQLQGIRRVLCRPPGAPRPEQADLDEAYRLAHSFKAGARVCGLRPMEQLGHQLETVLSRPGAPGAGPRVDPGAPGLIAAVELVLNTVEDWMAALMDGRATDDPVAAREAMARLIETPEAPAQSPSRRAGTDGPGASEAAAAADGTARHPHPAPISHDELRRRVRAAFQDEHREYLDGLTRFLDSVQLPARSRRAGTPGAPGQPASGASAADLDEAFRLGHSLKGAARVAEVPVVETLGHRLETLFARVRDGTLKLDQLCCQAIQGVIEAIEDEMTRVAADQPSRGEPAVLSTIEAILNGSGNTACSEHAAGPGAPGGDSPLDASDEPTTDATCAAANTAPAGSAAAPASPGPAAVAGAETVRVAVDALDRLLRATDQLHGQAARDAEMTAELGQIGALLDEQVRQWDLVRGTAVAALHRLDTMAEYAPLTRYLDFAEQQMRRLARRQRRLRQLHQRRADSLAAVNDELHREVRQARLVAAESVFHGLGAHVRDLARQQGKQVEFRATGLDVRADRAVLQALKDPLTHLLRNAVVHGIEPPPQRAGKGKPPAGRVALTLRTVGNHLEMLVEDDGAGLDLARIAAIAEQRGLIDGAADSQPGRLSRIIFEPGFTTAGSVSELAGRGMGLSVVHETVARLRGEVHARSAPGGGARVVIRVPVSVSTRRVLLVQCAGQTLAIPADGIDRLLRIAPTAIARVEGTAVIDVDGSAVAITSLAHLTGMGRHEESSNVQCVVLLKSDASRLAVAVDGFGAESDALVRNLDPPACHVEQFAGAVLLEDDTVALVVNPAVLVGASWAQPTGAGSPAPAPGAPGRATRRRKPPVVLVVDDSFTTRTLEKSILETQGYDVRTAVDGADALLQLRSALPGEIDLVVSDIQMPRVDGFALLEQMKRDEAMSRLPVILVTSLDRREDQQRGMELGADAYILKQKFDHRDLLETIRQMLCA